MTTPPANDTQQNLKFYVVYASKTAAYKETTSFDNAT